MKTMISPRLFMTAMACMASVLVLPAGMRADTTPPPNTTSPAHGTGYAVENDRDRRADRAVKNRDAHPTFKRSDHRLVKKAAACNDYEIALSRQAVTRSTDAQVRAYAENLIRDHERMGRELTTFAARRGVTLSENRKYQNDLDDLADEKGDDYDEAYLEAMIESHERAIKVLEKASKSSDSDLAAFAVQHLPTMKDHLARAKQLEKAID